MNDPARLNLARDRLGRWADPTASGNPTKRMTKIWPSPGHMASDIAVVLHEIEVRGG